jgi:hypothetical protein
MGNDLVYFHTLLENGEIEYQGHVIKELPFDFLEVQLYSFVTTEPTDIKIFEKSDFVKWKFYTTHDAWIQAHAENQKKYYP